MAAIDRLNGLGPLDSQANAVDRRVRASEDADRPPFQMSDYDRDGVVYTPGTDRTDEPRPKTWAEVNREVAEEEAEAARANLHTRFDGPGVAVELSTSAVQASARAQAQEKQTGSLFDIIKDIFKPIRDFFVAFWTGESQAQTDEAKEAQQVNADTEAIVQDLKETIGAELPQKYEQASVAELGKDPEDIASFMVDYGGRHLAKNSDLLTQYDRTGHITTVSATDRRRILQGEGKVRKYK